MKKPLALALALGLTLSLTACSGGSKAPAPTAAPSVAPTQTSFTAESPEIIKLAEMTAELQSVCEELAVLAAQNGWESDESVQAEFAAAAVLIETMNQIIEDPSMADGADMTATLAVLQEALDGTSTTLREKLSVPNDGAGAAPAVDPTQMNFGEVAFGDLVITVPEIFGEVTEQDGVFLASSNEYGGTITVTAATEIDLMPEEWDESLAAEAVQTLYGSVYTDIQFNSFTASDDMNGAPGVYMSFYGVNANGQNRLVQILRLYTPDLTAFYQVALSHASEDAVFIPEVDAIIVGSVTFGA